MWQAPRFWHRPGHPLATVLAPLGALYGAAGRLRFALARPERISVPVICVGNPGLGGGGKTPAAIAVARRLLALGAHPRFLTRGYGGRLAGPLAVDPARHGAREVGDEPLLLAAVVPTHVSRDRPAGARQAAKAGADVVVMDDGFQNPTLAKDLSLLVVDGEAGIGNGHIFPAGPLREPLARQLARASAVVIVGEGRAGEDVAKAASRAGVPVQRAVLRPRDGAPELAAREVVAFCGIARPEKFRASLEAEGTRVAALLPFADHHAYSAADTAQILAAADRHPGAALLTTEKDRVRLDEANDPGGSLRARVLVLPVELVFSEPARLDAMLAAAIGR